MVDKRKHIFLSDNKLIEKLERIKHIEKATFDEIFEKYLILPDSDNIIHDKFIEIEKLIVSTYGKKNTNFNDQKLRVLMELLWVMIVLSAKGDYDVDKLLHDITADFNYGIYKKR
jgi:hypothetical protein